MRVGNTVLLKEMKTSEMRMRMRMEFVETHWYIRKATTQLLEGMAASVSIAHSLGHVLNVGSVRLRMASET